MAAVASTVLSFRPIDEIESTLLDSWREVSKATHRFLALLREFDLRKGWRAYGNTDCAEWLNWKCGISRVTAQEKVRVAKALWTLPRIDAAFERGDVSYSKVRAVSRVATENNEAELLKHRAHVDGGARRGLLPTATQWRHDDFRRRRAPAARSPLAHAERSRRRHRHAARRNAARGTRTRAARTRIRRPDVAG